MSVRMQQRADDIARERAKAIAEWEPPVSPHCSNCSNARVTGTPEIPAVYCAAGFDGEKTITLWRLIRRSSPRGFRAASACPSFDSMGA